MKSILLILPLLLISSLSYACFAPVRGEKYDSLIEVSYLKDINEYQVKVPLKAYDLDFGVQVYLAVTRAINTPEEEEFIYINERTKLIARKIGNHMVANFSITELSVFQFRIQATWYPRLAGMCSAYGFSRPLQFNMGA